MRWLPILMLFACKKESLARVECNGAVDGLRCTVEHQQGSERVNVCWSVEIGCQNGNRSGASGCATVSPGQKVASSIPNKSITGLDKCDTATSMSVQNMSLTVAP